MSRSRFASSVAWLMASHELALARLLTDNPSPGIFQNVSHRIHHAAGDAFTVLGDDDLLDHDSFAEALRRRLSLNAAKLHAFGLAASDRARGSHGLYCALGGPHSNAHFVLMELLLRLPRPMAQALQRSVSAVSGSIAA